MTLDVQTYVPRPQPSVEAVQVTAENSRYINHNCWGGIGVGHWIVREVGRTNWVALSDAEFHRRYQPAPAEDEPSMADVLGWLVDAAEGVLDPELDREFEETELRHYAGIAKSMLTPAPSEGNTDG